MKTLNEALFRLREVSNCSEDEFDIIKENASVLANIAEVSELEAVEMITAVYTGFNIKG